MFFWNLPAALACSSPSAGLASDILYSASMAPDKEVIEIDLKEFIGHTPLEVLGGVLLGILIGMIIPA